MIEAQNLTIEKLKELEICKSWIGKYVIIRTYSAGVHCGILSNKIGNEVILKDARRIWKWTEAFTLSKIAMDGLGNESKLSIAANEIKLTEIEIIPCSDKAEKILREFKEFIP